MVKKYAILLMVLIVTLAALPACTRSATGSATGLITATAELPFEFTGGAQMTAIVAGTQTAAVAAGTPAAAVTVAPPEVTPDVPLPTPTETLEPSPTALPVFEWTPTPGRPQTHSVNQGEYPYCLARRFNVSLEDLLAANGLYEGSQLAIGQELKIPADETWPEEYPRRLMEHPTEYSVSAGETVYTIACLFGDVDPNAIIGVNGLEAPYTLEEGQVIYIP